MYLFDPMKATIKPSVTLKDRIFLCFVTQIEQIFTCHKQA